MNHLGLVLISLVFSLISPALREIDRAFLSGDAGVLKSLIAPGTFLNVSFSNPVSFSDLLSDEQAVLWFGQLFRTHGTDGFYPDPPLLERGSFVYKARWEVETPDRNPLAFDILFLIRGRPEGAEGRPETWALLQVRAERR